MDFLFGVIAHIDSKSLRVVILVQRRRSHLCLPRKLIDVCEEVIVATEVFDIVAMQISPQLNHDSTFLAVDYDPSPHDESFISAGVDSRFGEEWSRCRAPSDWHNLVQEDWLMIFASGLALS